MLPVCSPATLHRTSCAASPRCVSPGVHIASFATPKPALPGQPMPCTCGLATRVRAAYFLAPANMCAGEKNPPARLLHPPPPPFPGALRSLPPNSGPGTHSDRSLIHIFLLGADFSSRGDGQSDSSISGGLRGDSSMLSLFLWNRGRRQHRGSASAPNRKTLTPSPAPSHLRLAWTSQAGISRLGPSWQSCSSCGSSSPAAQPSSGLPVQALRAAAAARSRSRLLRLPSSPGRFPRPPLLSPLVGLPARLSLLAATPPRGTIGSRGLTETKAPEGGRAHPAPGRRGRACPPRGDVSACLPGASQAAAAGLRCGCCVGSLVVRFEFLLYVCVGFMYSHVPSVPCERR